MKNQVSLYDIFTKIVPGAILIVGMVYLLNTQKPWNFLICHSSLVWVSFWALMGASYVFGTLIQALTRVAFAACLGVYWEGNLLLRRTSFVDGRQFFSEPMRDRIVSIIRERLHLHLNENTPDEELQSVFDLCYETLFLNSQAVAENLNAMYGMCRSLCFVFLILGVTTLVHALISWQICFWGGLALLSFTAAIFYRERFAIGIYRAFAASHPI